MRNDPNILFEESQRFNQLWLWLLLVFANGFTAYRVVSLYLEEHSWEVPSLATLALLLGITIFFRIIRLESQISTNGISWRWYPFQQSFQTLHWDEITQLWVRKYQPILEYGGWGFRFGLKGKAYNIAGNKGIQIVKKNGKRFLIGTQKPEEAQKALDQLDRFPVPESN